MIQTLAIALAFLWAGIVIGGAWIAAPAKFTIDTLGLPQLLAVGQAQFLWLGRVELAFASALGASLFISLGASLFISRHPSTLIMIAIVVLVLQQLFVLPRLGLLTEARIAGTTPEQNHLHIAYMGLDAVKILCLIAAATLFTQSAQP